MSGFLHKKRFLSISLAEFRETLKGFFYAEFPDKFYEADWEPTGNGKWVMNTEMRPINEYCFMIPLVGVKYFIKVYSSVAKETKKFRDVGEDAIRLVAADEILKPIRRKFTRINRIGTWRENFHKRIETILEDLGNDMTCSSCGGHMVLRKSNRGINFLGCSNYARNRCRGRSIVVNK